MKATELEYIILKLRGARTLVNAMGAVEGGYGEETAPACFIIEDAITEAIESIKNLAED